VKALSHSYVGRVVSPPARRWSLAIGFLLLVLIAPTAQAGGLDDPADQWLPRSDGAEWVYSWTNSDYSPTPRTEKYAVQSRAGTLFRLRWDEVNTRPGDQASAGTMDFRHTEAGLVNVNYQSTQPPPAFPVLCASATDCGNSLAGPMYMLIWGTRSPTLAEPLLKGTRWNATGGASDDVASASRYIGHSRVTVPAFPKGINAAEVESEVTQGGALGDPFGTGVRTVWWVRGVGPVRIVFRHAGGEISEARLQSTTLKPLALPSDQNLLPINRGDKATFRWRNNRHMPKWSRQRFEVTEVVNNTARVDVKSLSGPIQVQGSYTFSSRISGVVHLQAATRAATRAKFPKLGPKGLPSDRRRSFFTPYDLMVFGFGPVTPIDVKKGDSWRSSRDSADFKIFGVSGVTRVLGTQKVRTPLGRYSTVALRSTLTQNGFKFGSGTRTMWFAPGKGLMKLVFRHRDGSVSTVERVG
jgi:hypothetical protein